jgi:hypothetical protein
MNDKISWKNHVVELIVVIIGITSALALNNWNENRLSENLETKYLQSLTKDIASDLQQLQELVEFYERAINSVMKLGSA